MRYPQKITLEVRNEEPDKKRQIATAGSFQTEPSFSPASRSPSRAPMRFVFMVVQFP